MKKPPRPPRPFADRQSVSYDSEAMFQVFMLLRANAHRRLGMRVLILRAAQMPWDEVLSQLRRDLVAEAA